MQKKKTDPGFIGLVSCLLFYLILHLFFKADYNDDAYFGEITAGFDSLTGWLSWRYATDSSRLISEGLLYILLRLPFAVWCVLDILVCTGLYHCLCVILTKGPSDKKNLIVLGAMLSYPFMHMASAGWLATTLNYLWPFAAIVYCVSLSFRRLRGEKPALWQYILAVPCLLLGANCEMPAAYMLMVFGSLAAAFIISKNEKKPVFEVLGLLTAVGGLVLAFTCPGNAERSSMELQWMPEFPELSFFDKFRLCSDFVFEHFVAIPNVLFLIFCLVLARKGKKGVLRFVPLILDLVFTAYYFVKRFIMGGLRSYDFDFLTARPEGAELAWQYAELLALLLFIASVLWILFRSDAATEKKWICAVALGSGFAVREALMLSPTMFASWHRTLIFFYFALLAVIVCLSETEESRAVLWIRRILFACGTLVNLILTIGHQFRR